MGALTEIIPQGPNQHCGIQTLHARHSNTLSGLPVGSWCDGLPPLGPFLELTVRVPLTGPLEPPGEEIDGGFEGLLQLILDEGLATYIWDEIDGVDTRAVLRLRAYGHDRVYPLKHGRVDPKQETLW